MDSTFIYTESARRKARKMKALAEGAAKQGKPLAAPGGLPPAAPAAARAQPIKAAPAGITPPPSIRRPAGAETIGGGLHKKSHAGQARPPSVRRPAGAESIRGGLHRKSVPGQSRPPAAAQRPAGAHPARGAATRHPRTPATALKANEERLLLESKELDLFGTGTSSKVCICPDCQHEIVKVVCLGIPVRACLECKGAWLSYPVIREFAREQDWFLQLGPAIQLEIDKKKRR